MLTHRLAPVPPWLLPFIVTPAVGILQLAKEALIVIPEGQRNTTLTSFAGAMRRSGMSPEEMFAALLIINTRRCTPPLTQEELWGISMSIARYAPAAPVVGGEALRDTDGAASLSNRIEHPTDLGNAERLVARHGPDLHYCYPWHRWVTWDDTRWLLDDTGEVMRR